MLILGEGPEREYLQDLITDKKLTENVRLVGFVNNVYPYFKAANLCVMSSRIEGFPNVLLQMMSQNNKVVSTISAGGIDEIEGIFTCETNEIALSNAIRICLKSNTEKNNVLFNQNLQNRTVEAFVSEIFKNITNTR